MYIHYIHVSMYYTQINLVNIIVCIHVLEEERNKHGISARIDHLYIYRLLYSHKYFDKCFII